MSKFVIECDECCEIIGYGYDYRESHDVRKVLCCDCAEEDEDEGEE